MTSGGTHIISVLTEIIDGQKEVKQNEKELNQDLNQKLEASQKEIKSYLEVSQEGNEN